MAFKDILIHIGTTEHCDVMLDLAIKLARKSKGKLTGLYVIAHTHFASQHECGEPASMQCQEIFTQKTAAAGIPSEWLCVDTNVVGVEISDVINAHAYCKDLVILGQPNYHAVPVGAQKDLRKRVIMGSGRPVLIVPYTGRFETIGERVMVAWKPGREASRAINDAMPLLMEAKEVRIMAVTAPNQVELGDKEPYEDICAHLALHGIQAQGDRFVSEDISTSDVLLNQVWEEGCDLLVMGAYSNSKTQMKTARELIRHMVTPVLMSH